MFDDKIAAVDRTSSKTCLGGGKYCARPFYSYEELDPVAVVQENIYQKCIWKHCQSNKEMYRYFDYLIIFYNRCYKKTKEKESDFSIECGKAAMDKAGLPTDKINECYIKSFLIKEDLNPAAKLEAVKIADNSLLDADNFYKQLKSVKMMPSLFVNGKQFYGTYEKKAVLEMICSGILKKPEVCFKDGGFLKADFSGRVFWKFFLLTVLIILGISMIIYIACKKYMAQQVIDKLSESEIDLKVNTVVTSYLALKDKH